jgi:very-short-patch-repair endonuclease
MRGQKFRREHPIGPYTVNFVCLALKLIVEVDGKDHFNELETGKRWTVSVIAFFSNKVSRPCESTPIK